jgi:hypothetical protein
MKNKHLMQLGLTAIVTAGMWLPVQVLAQQYTQDGSVNGSNDVDNQGGSNGVTGDTTTTTTNSGGFDWRWLLPLVAIPIILLLVYSGRGDDARHYRDDKFMTAKGGKQTIERDDKLD